MGVQPILQQQPFLSILQKYDIIQSFHQKTNTYHVKVQLCAEEA